MSEEQPKLSGPDFVRGLDLSYIPDGTMLLGHAHGEPVLLVRRNNKLFAIGANCTHYGAPLADGLVVGETIRCPWHHACFSLDTGEALRPPALKPVSRWRVEEVPVPLPDLARQNTPVDQTVAVVYVREKLEPAAQRMHSLEPGQPRSVVIVGGGAAGNAAATTLRQEGYSGSITMLSADTSAPYDRPNLSKGFLAGTATEESNALRPLSFYDDHDIDLRLGVNVVGIDTQNRQVQLADGKLQPYEALLLATGAEPVRLDVPGADLPHVHYLRTLADCHALLAKASTSQRAVVIGASFIGLEVAASLRARKLEVQVVGRETGLMEKVLGAPVGAFLRRLHESHGVIFHLGATVDAIDAHGVSLAGGATLAADLVVVGIGVRPATSLAKQAGLAMDGGVLVNEYLETSVPGIFAAGDIARWPDALTGERIRVEHWVVAERQGQTAARNMLGRHERFDAVPFFWTEQYDFGLAYVGHAERFDQVEIDGLLDKRDCKIIYWCDGEKLAEAVVHRDLEGLRAEVAVERTIAESQAVAT
jgi:NADPH-dependent 2,4-dienoyl-CoA reductase/sulfur reductase-like enzyme/nitrite reductase/ring-hydroxylating ferredoxin subunit